MDIDVCLWRMIFENKYVLALLVFVLIGFALWANKKEDSK
jgi:hypothetical protein